jgi:adenylate kinase
LKKKRWIHLKSGRTYHEIHSPPKINQMDDFTNEPLTQREDDLNKEAIKMRIENFETKTKPTIELFKKEFQLFELDGEKGIKEIQEKIKSLIL